jgi:hypothetical protein
MTSCPVAMRAPFTYVLGSFNRFASRRLCRREMASIQANSFRIC